MGPQVIRGADERVNELQILSTGFEVRWNLGRFARFRRDSSHEIKSGKQETPPG